MAQVKSMNAPSETPKRDWRKIWSRVARDVSQKNLTFLAAGAAFNAFLAIPAGIALLVSLAIFAFGAGTVQSHAAAIRRLIPSYVAKLLTDPHSAGTLAIGLIISLAIDLWTVRSGSSCMLTALTLACGENEKRSFVKRQMIILLLAAITLPFVLISLALIAVPAEIINLPLSSFAKTTISAIRWPVLVVLFMTVVVWIYHHVPQRTAKRALWRSTGVVFATVIWIVGSAGFSIYLTRFQDFDPSYGALGAIIVLLGWLNFTAFSVLLGAQINDALERES